MSEIHFIAEEAPEGGFIACAVGADIYTEADDPFPVCMPRARVPCIAISTRTKKRH
jgi:hypothetical protein